MIECLFLKGTPYEESADILLVGVFSGEHMFVGANAILDSRCEGWLSRVVREDGFKGGVGETLLLRPPTGLAAKRVLLVGLGDAKMLSQETIRIAAGTFFHSAVSVKAKRLATTLIGVEQGIHAKEAAKSFVEGMRLASYTYGRYKKDQESFQPVSCTVFVQDGKMLRSAMDGSRLGELFGQATNMARDLVNTPGHHMSPADLVRAAEDLSKGKGTIRVKVFPKERLEQMGAGGLLGIAQGSDHPPYLVHLTYTPKKPTKKTVAIVGKAVTFDSGGLSLKPADAMMTMKLDMAGAAAVLGVFSVLQELAPHTIVHGIFGAVENMPSGKAIRPGDVVKTLNGKTIEILNTDAEGRVTLADTLAYAAKLKPKAIVDLATLTGACMVALGEEMTGLMANDRVLADTVLTASKTAGESMWELPLEPRYKPLLVSDVADYKNIAGRYGGAITAGLLLAEFVEDIPWVHLDIAGPAFAEKPLTSYLKKGATGHGVRTLLSWLQTF